MTVSGAYGRDYKSLKAAQSDWSAGKDFVIRDLFSGGAGRYINRQDAIAGKVRGIRVRYSADRKIGALR